MFIFFNPSRSTGARHAHYDTPPEVHGPLFNERFYSEPDDNELIAKAINRQNRRSLARRTILRRLLLFTNPCTALPTTLTVPQKRPFQWMIESDYFPEEYHAKSLRKQTPWYLLLRCRLIDLPEQLENRLSTVSWRDYQVKDSSSEPQFLTRPLGFPQLKWGQRIVVGYLWSDNREWALSANRIGNLASFSNTICIRACQNFPGTRNTRLYQLDRTSDKPEPIITLFPRLRNYRGYRPPPALPGTPVPQSLLRLWSLMNNEARAFLYGPSLPDPAQDSWLGNIDRPRWKELSDADSHLPPESSRSKPE